MLSSDFVSVLLPPVLRSIFIALPAPSTLPVTEILWPTWSSILSEAGAPMSSHSLLSASGPPVTLVSL